MKISFLNLQLKSLNGHKCLPFHPHHQLPKKVLVPLLHCQECCLHSLCLLYLHKESKSKLCQTRQGTDSDRDRKGTVMDMLTTQLGSDMIPSRVGVGGR